MIGGVDIGGTKIAVGAVNEHGHVLARDECPTAPERGLDDGLARIASMLHEVEKHAGDVLRGIGIGCTGPVHPLVGTIGDVEFLPGWQGVNLVDELSRRFGLSVAIENDADAAALGEASWGAGRDVRSFLYVTIGTGIGGGLVFEGQIYRGVGDSHPEIGHHVIDPSGPACFCGAHGCWESLASGPALVRWVQNSQLPGVLVAEGLDARAICAAAERGEAFAQAAVTRAGTYLGLGLANLVTLFSPDVIALGGGLMRSRHLFWAKMLETVRTNCGLVPHQQVRIVPAELGADTGLIGAASVWLNRYGK
jgi:glucokinase